MAITSRGITLGEKRQSRKTSYHSLNDIMPSINLGNCFFVFSGNKKLVLVGKRPQWGRIFEVSIYEESEGDT